MSYLRSFFYKKQHGFIRPVVAVAGLTVAAMTLGCGESELTHSAKIGDAPLSQTPSAASQEATTSVAVSATKTEVSPAKRETKLPDADTSPEAVCQLFMKYLNSGDRVKAERLLTSVAFDTTAKAGLYLQPMGSVDADVTISPAVYATNQQQLAHVECTITEIENGKPIRDELTWMVRKSKSGWRIFGMLLTLEEGRQDFLSLENVQDVDAILLMSGDNASMRNAQIDSAVLLK